MESHKKDHKNLTLESQTLRDEIYPRFRYEPFLNLRPSHLSLFTVLGSQFKAPLWVSSTTGGAQLAGNINSNLYLQIG